MDWNSDINDNDNEEFSWESDDDEKENRTGMPGEACEAGPSQPSLYSHFISMGFSKSMVEKAIKENGEGNSEAVLETLLTYSAIENPYSENEDGPIESSIASNVDGLDDDSSDTDDFDDQCQFFLVRHTSLKSQKRNLAMWKTMSYMKTQPR